MMVPALCGQGRKTHEIKSPRWFISKKASTICVRIAKSLTDSSYKRANAGFPAGALEQLNS